MSLVRGQGSRYQTHSDSPTFSTVWNVVDAGSFVRGIALAQGEVADGMDLRLGAFPTQTAVLARWPDDSIRHAAVICQPNTTGPFNLVPVTAGGSPFTPTWPSASLTFTIGSDAYVATLPAYSGAVTTVFSGPIAHRGFINLPLKLSGTPHVTLTAKFEITTYASGGWEVSIDLRNIKNVSGMDKFTGDLVTVIEGDTFADMSKTSFTVFAGTMWHRKAFVDVTEAIVEHDWTPFQTAGIFPVIGGSDAGASVDLSANSFKLGGGDYLGFSSLFGLVGWHQGDSENFGRDELEPIAAWEARWIFFNTETYRQITLRNADQSGGWTQAIDKDGSDGDSILRLDQDSNYVSVITDYQAPNGLGWTPDACEYRGSIYGSCTPGYPSAAADVNREHVPESNFMAYVTTCDTAYLDRLRFQGSWMLFFSYPSDAEIDPYLWAGYERGRNGINGWLSDSEIGRGFGRPLRVVNRAAWAIPDRLSSDQAYFQTYAENQLDAAAYYADYLASRNWDQSPFYMVGANAAGHTSDTWQYRNPGTVVSSTLGATTTIVTNVAHLMSTGDFVDLSGFVASGATALNGTHVGPITKLSATSFSVPVTTVASTSGQGAWVTITAPYLSHWRAAVTAWEISWMGFTGLWTMSDARWAFPDLLAKTMKSLQSYPSVDTAPGIAYNYYPVPGRIAGDTYVLESDWSDFQTLNESGVFIAGVTGNPNWNPASPNTYYTTYAMRVLTHGVKRGLSGMSAAYARLEAANEVLGALTVRPGFYQVP